jgi:hypothetical protein
MLKLATSETVKQVYSDTVGSHGRAEVAAFFTEYVGEVNPYACLDWIRKVKKPDGEYWYFEVEGKYYDTLTQDMVDKFNSGVTK